MSEPSSQAGQTPAGQTPAEAGSFPPEPAYPAPAATPPESETAPVPAPFPSALGAQPLGIAPADEDPLGLAGTVDLLAATLRADASDLESYERVLVATFADSLPAGMVEIDRERSLGDRMAGRPGKVTAIRVRLGESTLELRAGRGGLTGVLARGVRGVTISRQEVPVAQWTQLLAEHLHALAVQNAEARAALGRLLGAE